MAKSKIRVVVRPHVKSASPVARYAHDRTGQPPRVTDASEALWSLLDGADSPLISLKNRLTLLQHLAELKIETVGTQHSALAFAIDAHIQDIQQACGDVEERITTAYEALEPTPSSAG